MVIYGILVSSSNFIVFGLQQCNDLLAYFVES